ncbi:MAG: DUF4445 domain-containing protein [Desulfovibrio sp.]|nr:DUF4445 domain-containing protein [Desulfovibrio sp.]
MLVRIHASPDQEALGHALDIPLSATPGQTLSQAIWLSGRIPPLPLCAGLGRCGRCRVRFLNAPPPPLPAEIRCLSANDLAEGWRLACRQRVPEGMTEVSLELPTASLARSEDRTFFRGTTTRSDLPELALAVDLGTTSLCWRALDAQNGATLADGQALNPQAGAGADVMSRLAVAQAPGQRRRLAHLTRHLLRGILTELKSRRIGRVTRICLAANTAMTDIFCNRDVRGLCAAPYQLSHSGNEMIDLPGLPPVYLPPLPAPFVGGDTSAGLASLLAKDTPRPILLADLGTNGELALLTHQKQLWLTSVPLGPALEGIGPECGQLVGPGVVTAFHLCPTGLKAVFHASTMQEKLQKSTARGISATGYLSLLAVLLRTGILDRNGHFTRTATMPLTRRLTNDIQPGYDHMGTRLRLPHGLWLSAADIEDLLKVKAAFVVALQTLFAQAKCNIADVACFCLAGALGTSADVADLLTLGMIPPTLKRVLRVVGNVALDGAELLALHEDMRPPLAQLCAQAHVLCLADDPHFHNNYLRQMRFGD